MSVAVAEVSKCGIQLTESVLHLRGSTAACAGVAVTVSGRHQADPHSSKGSICTWDLNFSRDEKYIGCLVLFGVAS